jgi:hypothetical protein
MIYVCEHCRRATELFYCRSDDSYLCEPCLEVVADEGNDDEADLVERFNVWEDLSDFDDPSHARFFDN